MIRLTFHQFDWQKRPIQGTNYEKDFETGVLAGFRFAGG